MDPGIDPPTKQCGQKGIEVILLVKKKILEDATALVKTENTAAILKCKKKKKNYLQIDYQ